METEQPVTESGDVGDDRLAAALYGSDLPEEAVEQEQPEQAGEQAATEGEQTPAGPELIDVEYNGKQYKLQPELKDALMAQSDYTRKTQEVAERRRMVDLQALTMQQEAQFQQSVAQEIQTLGALDYQIAQYVSLDWAQMDTDTLVRTRHNLDLLRDKKGEVQKSIQDKRGQFEQGMSKLMSEARDKGNEYLKRNIPQWGAESQKELMTYGISQGYSDVELNTLNDARMIHTLWKANQWDKLQSQKGATQQKVRNAPPISKPGASENQSNQQSRDRAYKAALKSAKTPAERARILDQRIAEKMSI